MIHLRGKYLPPDLRTMVNYKGRSTITMVGPVLTRRRPPCCSTPNRPTWCRIIDREECRDERLPSFLCPSL